MEREYNNLILAAAKFAEDWWLSIDESLEMLKEAVLNKMINFDDLKNDFNGAISDLSFDWIDFAYKSELLISPNLYTAIDIKNFLKFCMYDYLFPKKALNLSQLECLYEVVENILKQNKKNNGWMYSYDLYNQILNKKEFKNIEYYNLWYISLFSKISKQTNIETKTLNDLNNIIGMLRFIPNSKSALEEIK